MAYADLKTGKIIGAEVGTKTYYHEEAHLKYDDTKFGRRIRTLQFFSKETLIAGIVLTLLYPIRMLRCLMVYLLVFTYLFDLIEEFQCWNYAKIKLRKKEDDNKPTEIQKV